MSGAQPATAAAGTQDKSIETIVRPFLANPCHVGLSVAIIREQQLSFYNFGSTSREIQAKPTADSVYEIASVTKTFTGALAAKAVVEHRMQLDADFRRYLPGSYPNLAWQRDPITLRSLAAHTSGLPRDLPDTDDLFAHPDPETLPFKLIARDSRYDRARYLRELHGVRLLSRPGSREVYSNLGFKVISWGLEQVYGKAFERLTQERVLQPLSMKSTGFVLRPAQQRRRVRGYSPAGNVMPYHLRNAGAAYGLYSTPRDMAKYVKWQLDESDPVIRLAHEAITGNGHDGKGLAWNLGIAGGSRMLWHGGGTFGMTSQVVLFPDDHEGYVLLANDACSGTEGALKQLAVELHASRPSNPKMKAPSMTGSALPK